MISTWLMIILHTVHCLIQFCECYKTDDCDKMLESYLVSINRYVERHWGLKTSEVDKLAINRLVHEY